MQAYKDPALAGTGGTSLLKGKGEQKENEAVAWFCHIHPAEVGSARAALSPHSACLLQLGRSVCAPNWRRLGDPISALDFLHTEKDEMG